MMKSAVHFCQASCRSLGLAAAAAAGLASGSPDARAEVVWRGFHGTFPSAITPVFIDMDGDGRNEIAYVGAGGVAIYQWRDDAFSLVDVLAIEPPVENPVLHRVPASHGGPERLMMVAGNLFGGRILEIGGLPMRVIRRFTDLGPVAVVRVGDFDADGRLDLLVRSDNQYPHWLRMLDFQTEAPKWSVDYTGSAIGRYDVGRLGASAKQWVVELRDDTLVRDSAEGLVQWAQPVPEFGSVTMARPHAGGDWGFVAAHPISYDTQVRVFAGLPPALQGEYTVLSGRVSVFDVDQDGADEAVVVGSRPDWPIRVLDLLTGVQLASFPSVHSMPYTPAFGRLTEDGALLMAYAGSPEPSHSGGVPGLAVLDVASQTLVHEPVMQPGAFRSAFFADMDGSGHDRQVVLVRFPANKSVHPQDFIAVRVLADDGAVLQERLDLFDDGLDWRYPIQVAVADLDGAAGDEIVLAGRDGMGRNVVVALSATLQTRWRRIGDDVDLPFGVTEALAVAATGVGSAHDVVLITASAGSNRLFVLAGATGLTIDDIAVGQGFGIHDLAVGQIDDDPAPEIVIRDQMRTWAFDAWTRTLDWTIPVSWGNAQIWAEAGGCRIGFLNGSLGVVDVRDCRTLDLLYQVQVPIGSTFAIPDGIVEGGFITTRAGRVLRLQRGEAPAIISDYLGADLIGLPARMRRPVPDGSGDVELLLTSQSYVSRFRIDGRNMIFQGDFEGEP